TALQARLRESTAVLERDRKRRAESAVEDERARLAGELQAVIANGVSAIVLQAEAVPRVIAAGERSAAETALARIETTGRETLAETRRLLGILRREGDDRALAPQPTLTELTGLADQMRGRGLAVALEIEGDRGELAAGPDLAAYRVVQQALSDSLAVGAREARVLVRYGPDELHVEVRDDRAEARIDADRLLAMRERLGLYGGRVRAGRDEEGEGFALIAKLPGSGVAA
ncbi:MAG TPA: histidine kinase, partial [Solirubrobacterales bacterium]|nr:histidine kinase [Solirubrobacterales bacterium]